MDKSKVQVVGVEPEGEGMKCHMTVIGSQGDLCCCWDVVSGRDVLFTHMLREGAVMCMLGASSCSVGPRQCSEVGCPATALPPLTQCVPGISFLRGDRV